MASESLNVIALISGGKDSFFSLLHCIQQGHRVVALANLFPAGEHDLSRDVQVIDPDQELPTTTTPAGASSGADGARNDDGSDTDLNSFMYQTVGHQVIPLYAAATGLPLYRQPIVGGAVRHERDYDYDHEHGPDSSAAPAAEPTLAPRRRLPSGSDDDETESMLPLLRAIKARHPEANGLCSGAILSTYQRTRVESVALRLGLVPLAYLWKYTVLPPQMPMPMPTDPVQLLRDMAAAGLEARIIKVASAGLDEQHLWESVSSDLGADRVKAALRKFGAAEGAALGEGGEFETLVVNGPLRLFKKSIVVPEGGISVVNEGGGSKWLMIRGAHLQDKPSTSEDGLAVREPHLLEARFQPVLEEMLSAPVDEDTTTDVETLHASKMLSKAATAVDSSKDALHWSVTTDFNVNHTSIQAETLHVVDRIRHLLDSISLDAANITSIIVVLRDMSDFPEVNGEYGKLFTKPNPPSRITISCGDLLPSGCNIMIHVTAPAPRANGVRLDRDGLHVQSRSYWAPANIGPYSQAINVPITAQQEPSEMRAIYVAGQIPLIPASMVLPPQCDTSLELQTVLSLQHLWRIGTDLKVQHWTSAVAYIASSSSQMDTKRAAKLAGRAWRLAHEPPEEDDDDADNGPDPWDLKYNPQYMVLGGGNEQNINVALPDFSILTLRQQNEPASCVPPFFAVELEELPRKASIEWHAHIGLSHVKDSSVEMIHVPEATAVGWVAWHMAVKAPESSFAYSLLACSLPGDDGTVDFAKLVRDMDTVYQESIRQAGLDASVSVTNTPYLVYLDATKIDLAGSGAGQNAGGKWPFAHIPSRSIWSENGERMACVALYKTAFLHSSS